MKSFKQFLNEKYINSSVKEWEAAIRGWMPITASLLKDNETKIPKAFKVASIESLKSLYKYQHQKKQISTFTKGSFNLSFGAILKAEVLVELKGKAAITFKKDASTVVDRNGRRWLSTLDKRALPDTWEVFVNDVLIEIDEYMQKNHSEYYGDYKFSWEPSDNIEQNLKIVKKYFTGKDKKDFIKWYFKMIKEYLDNDIFAIVKDEMHNRAANSDFENDEVVLHDYEVVHWWFYEGEDYQYFYEEILPDEEIYRFADGETDTDTEEEFIKKYHFDEFTKWKSNLAKKYPGLCSNYVTRKEVEMINVERHAYPSCKK
jgi:hypothetical protein